MKTELEIAAAHDAVAALVLREIPLELGLVQRAAAKGALDALCWVLDHDHNQTFASNLRKLAEEAYEKGYVLEKKQD